jgi:hypothetical protein
VLEASGGVKAWLGTTLRNRRHVLMAPVARLRQRGDGAAQRCSRTAWPAAVVRTARGAAREALSVAGREVLPAAVFVAEEGEGGGALEGGAEGGGGWEMEEQWRIWESKERGWRLVLFIARVARVGGSLRPIADGGDPRWPCPGHVARILWRGVEHEGASPGARLRIRPRRRCLGAKSCGS